MESKVLNFNSVIDPVTSRRILIETMLASGLLVDNNLGRGYVDYHDENDVCCVNFKLSTGNEIIVRIR